MPRVSHTPGPWEIQDLPFGIEEEQDQPCLLIKGFHSPAATAQGIIAIVEYLSGFPQEAQERADANLIATAPELLEACDEHDTINAYIESCDLPGDTQHPLWPVVVKMRAAADKARGR